MTNKSVLLATPIILLLTGTVKLQAENDDGHHTIVADHPSACRESEKFRPDDWYHRFLTPIESFTSTSSGKDALVLNKAIEQFVMPDGSRAYPRYARFNSDFNSTQDVQSGEIFFTLPGKAVLKANDSSNIPSFENVRIVRNMEMGPGIKVSCHVEFSKPVVECRTDYPYALVPPAFNVQACKIVGLDNQ